MNGTWRTSTGSSPGGSSSRSWSPRRSITVRIPYATSASQPAGESCPTLSARTTEPNLVSAPSPVGWPPRSRTFRQPSQMSSRLRCNCCELDASEGRRRGVLDPDLHQLARCRRAGEDDRRVAARAAAQDRWIGAARALDEHFLDTAHPLAVACFRDVLHALDAPPDRPALALLRRVLP